MPVPSNEIGEATTSPVISNVLAVSNCVAVVAVPVKSAVITPALKFPDPSRETIVTGELVAVALEVTVNVAVPELL